jgi:hypothetical protein
MVRFALYLIVEEALTLRGERRAIQTEVASAK